MSAASQTHPPIRINGNRDFTAANGVTSGAGTASDPYLIDGWQIVSSAMESGIEIRNTDAHFIIRDVYVYPGSSRTGSENGTIFMNVNNGVLQNSTFQNNLVGIFVSGSANIILDDVVVLMDSGPNVGIRIELSENVTIRRNNISQFGDIPGTKGVVITDTANVAILDIQVLSNRAGAVSLISSKNATISGSRLHYAGDVWIAQSADVTVSRNTISGGSFGVHIDKSNNTVIARNRIVGNSEGVTISSSSYGNRIYGNDLAGNGYVGRYGRFPHNAEDNGVNTSWDIGYPGGGNFWSDYEGIDQCIGPEQNACTSSDGVGDTPYIIYPDSRDNYPFVTTHVIPDTTPPRWSNQPRYYALNVTSTSLSLFWDQAVDDVRLASYRIYQENRILSTVPGKIRNFNITGLLPGTTYLFRVEAGDTANNWSNNGPSLTVTTALSWWQQYWYLLPTIVVAVALPVLARRIRGNRGKEQKTLNGFSGD